MKASHTRLAGELLRRHINAVAAVDVRGRALATCHGANSVIRFWREGGQKMISALIIVVALGFAATVWAIMRLEKALLKQRPDAPSNVPSAYLPLP